MAQSEQLTGPIKSNDNNYMYNYCKQKILKASKHQELLSMIQILIPMDTFKDKLIEIIDSLKQKKQNNTLKQLYLKSSSIAEIFPDHILVNIVKYLPSEQFCVIPLLSHNFHNIMIKYPILYNNYKVVIDEIPMYYNTQYIKLLLNHKKKSIYIKLAETEYAENNNLNIQSLRSIGSITSAGSNDNSMMFTTSFDSKWGGLIPNFSMQNSLGPKIEYLNPFSVLFPWSNIPKWILFGDKWSQTKNIITNSNINTMNDSNDSNEHNVKDIWRKAAGNIITLELENCSQHFICELPTKFNRLSHLKFAGILNDTISKSININLFPYLLYLEFHKIEIDAQSNEMSKFLETETSRYENIYKNMNELKENKTDNNESNDDTNEEINENINEVIGIRARINYKYEIINNILQCFKHLIAFKYFDDGTTINSIEMDMCNNNKSMVNVINKLRQNNGVIQFNKSLQFISLINCDCILDFSECNNIIVLNLYGINYTQIKWPINNNIIQCLICSTQTEITQDWNNIFETNIINKTLPIRFFKRITNRTLEQLPIDGINVSKSNSSGVTNEIYVENKLHKLYKLNMGDVPKKEKSIYYDVFQEYKTLKLTTNDNKLMCMEIEDGREIFYRLMKTIYAQNNDLLQNKIEIYEKWWKLKVALWIKRIGKQIISSKTQLLI